MSCFQKNILIYYCCCCCFVLSVFNEKFVLSNVSEIVCTQLRLIALVSGCFDPINQKFTSDGN